MFSDLRKEIVFETGCKTLKYRNNTPKHGDSNHANFRAAALEPAAESGCVRGVTQITAKAEVRL
jgi:hypothetical protein